LAKRYFVCRQFDWIADYLGVSLRTKNRYEFRAKLPQKASFRYFSRMIVFDEPWFRRLSDEGRCAALAHELGHSKSRGKGIGGALFVRFMLPGWTVVAGLLAFGVTAVSGVPLLFGLSFLGFMALFLSFGMKAVFSYAMWPTEFYCDEVATLYFGAESVTRELNTLPRKTPRFWSTHPPTRLRLERVETIGSRHPKPLIDFKSLDERLPQELISAQTRRR
jgi:Zn-dependent protease with chaperone function